MDLEWHQLDLRYESLRRRAPERERRLLASLAQSGQQVPVVVVGGEGGAWTLIDGYKRARALKQLKADTVHATAWDLAEAEALVLERLMRIAGADDAFEQGWLLRELQGRFSISQEDLARRFDRSVSWVSRRLALVNELPEEVQSRVRAGRLVAHAAMKYLVPLARANRTACVTLVTALGSTQRATSRQVGALYRAWLGGNRKARELLLADPWLVLRAQAEGARQDPPAQAPATRLLEALGSLGTLSRQAQALARRGVVQRLEAGERDEMERCRAQAEADARGLFELLGKELGDARPGPAHDHP